MLSRSAADGYERPLSDLVPNLPVSGTLAVTGDPKREGDRISASVTISAPDLFRDLDALGRGRGNMGSFEHRLYWVGPTSLSGIEDGRVVRLASRARYENWIRIKVLFDEIKNKNFQDTKGKDLTVEPDWLPGEKLLRLEYRLDNIRNFPGELERILQDLGVRFGGETELRITDDAAFAALDPEIHSWTARAINNNAGLAFDVDLSVDAAAAALYLGDRLDLVESAKESIGQVFGLFGFTH